MLFTIAIPTYNNSKTVEKAITCAINQDFKEKFEIIVLNNNSTDDTTDVLKKFEGSIYVINNSHTVTMYENHNLCINYASGKYLIFCHSDDFLLPDALSKYYNVLSKRNFPNRYVLWGRSMFRDFYLNWENGGFRFNEIASGVKSLEIFLNGGLTPSGTCYSRESFLEVGGFIIVNHQLAPSDLVTMWKLIINHFEFEMTDRIFFNRVFASTATNSNMSYKNIKESIIDAIKCLEMNVSESGFNLLLENFKSNSYFNPFMLNILIENNYLKSKDFRYKLISEIVKKPYCLKNREIRKMIWLQFFTN